MTSDPHRQAAAVARDFWGPMLRRSGVLVLLALVGWAVVLAIVPMPGLGMWAAVLVGGVLALVVFYVSCAIQYNRLPRSARDLGGAVDRHDIDMRLVDLTTLLETSEGASPEAVRTVERVVDDLEMKVRDAELDGCDTRTLEAYVAMEFERNIATLDADPALLAPVLDFLNRVGGRHES